MVKEVISNKFRKGIIHFLEVYQPPFSEFLTPSYILWSMKASNKKLPKGVSYSIATMSFGLQ